MPKLFIVRLSEIWLGQKMLKFEFAKEAIIIFLKSIKRYVHFFGNRPMNYDTFTETCYKKITSQCTE